MRRWLGIRIVGPMSKQGEFCHRQVCAVSSINPLCYRVLFPGVYVVNWKNYDPAPLGGGVSKAREEWKMINLVIQGMTCEHCKGAVKTALESVTGVSLVNVHLERGSADVEGTANLDALIQAVQEEGYQASSGSS